MTVVSSLAALEEVVGRVVAAQAAVEEAVEKDWPLVGLLEESAAAEERLYDLLTPVTVAALTRAVRAALEAVILEHDPARSHAENVVFKRRADALNAALAPFAAGSSAAEEPREGLLAQSAKSADVRTRCRCGRTSPGGFEVRGCFYYSPAAAEEPQ